MAMSRHRRSAHFPRKGGQRRPWLGHGRALSVEDRAVLGADHCTTGLMAPYLHARRDGSAEESSAARMGLEMVRSVGTGTGMEVMIMIMVTVMVMEMASCQWVR